MTSALVLHDIIVDGKLCCGFTPTTADSSPLQAGLLISMERALLCIGVIFCNFPFYWKLCIFICCEEDTGVFWFLTFLKIKFRFGVLIHNCLFLSWVWPYRSILKHFVLQTLQQWCFARPNFVSQKTLQLKLYLASSCNHVTVVFVRVLHGCLDKGPSNFVKC